MRMQSQKSCHTWQTLTALGNIYDAGGHDNESDSCHNNVVYSASDYYQHDKVWGAANLLVYNKEGSQFHQVI